MTNSSKPEGLDFELTLVAEDHEGDSAESPTSGPDEYDLADPLQRGKLLAECEEFDRECLMESHITTTLKRRFCIICIIAYLAAVTFIILEGTVKACEDFKEARIQFMYRWLS